MSSSTFTITDPDVTTSSPNTFGSETVDSTVPANLPGHARLRPEHHPPSLGSPDDRLDTVQANNQSTLLMQNLTLENGHDNIPVQTLSKIRTVLLIFTLTGITFANSMSTGLFTIGVPLIAADLRLADNLLLWPAAVSSLASGCTLLLAGSIADFVGNRIINLSGGFILGFSILACGLSRTGLEFILFRAVQGLGLSMCFPTALSILTQAFPHGRRRNIAFACLGLGAPFGWSVGLFLGGFLESGALGWRFGFYVCAGAAVLLSVINCWRLPRDRLRTRLPWSSIGRGIDWIGVLLSSACLGMFSYVFANITGSLSNIRDASNITCLCIAAVLIPAFVYWMHYQEALRKPALIPNSIWKNPAFTSICVMVLLSWGVLNSMELFLSLFFQQVQQISVIQTSLRFLPNVIVGIMLNLCTGLLVHRFRADYMVLSSSVLCAVSPLLMGIIDPDWSFWYCGFWVVILGPLSADVIFTVANLIITDVFAPNTQALAGAVFNTVAQFGTSIGIAVTAIISASVTDHSSFASKKSPEALMLGYRAAFWACFVVMILTCGVGAVGLRKVGRVGLKKD